MKVGDTVRVAQVDKGKGKKPSNFSTEIYKVAQVFRNLKNEFELDSYKLKNDKGKFLEGRYNISQL